MMKVGYSTKVGVFCPLCFAGRDLKFDQVLTKKTAAGIICTGCHLPLTDRKH